MRDKEDKVITKAEVEKSVIRLIGKVQVWEVRKLKEVTFIWLVDCYCGTDCGSVWHEIFSYQSWCWEAFSLELHGHYFVYLML